MSLSSDDLSELRSTLSDDQILQGVIKNSPSEASDLGDLQKSGLSSKQILDGYTKYHAENKPRPNGAPLSTATNFGQAAAYGLASEAHALGETSKALGVGDGSWMKRIEDFSNGAGGMLGDMTQYRPATADMGLDKSLWSNISSIPRAMVEGAPMVAGMGLAGAGAVAAAPEMAGAGLLGATGYGLIHHLGNQADERATNNGRAEPTTADVVQALPGAALRSVADAAGNRMLMGNSVLRPSAVTGAGKEAMAQTAMNLAKTGATNVATGAASDAIGQAGSEIGTDKGYHPDVNQSLNAGVVGGLTSLGMKGLEAVPQSIANSRLKVADPAIRQSVADDLNSTRFTGNPDDPADHGKLMTNALNGYTKDVSNDIQDAKAKAKEIEATGGSASHIKDALDYADNLMGNLKTGKLDPSQIAEAKDKLSGQPDLLNNILKVNEVHVISEAANLKGSHNADSPSMMDYYKGYKAYKGMSYMAGAALMGHNPVLGGLLAATPFALTVLSRAKAAMAGDNRIVSGYAQRFGSQPDPQAPMANAPAPQRAPPEVSQPQPEGPVLHGEILPPPTRHLQLPAPPIYGGSPSPQYGPNDGVPQGEPFTPHQAPEAPRMLPAPMRHLPAPPIYGQPPERGFADQAGAEMPSNLLMLRAALQRAQGGEQPPQAPEAPQAPQSPLQAPVNTQAVAALSLQKQRAMQALAAKEFAARQNAKETVAPSEAPPAASFNDRADEIEKTIKDAQAVIGDPSSAPDAVAMAKSALRKAAGAAAAQHDATKGGSAKAKSGGTKHPSETHVHPGMTHIHTSVGEKVQANAHIRKSPEAIGQGVEKSRGTRFHIADAAKKLSLSPEGHTKIGEAMDALKSKVEAKATNNRAHGKAALEEALKGFNEHDRSILQHHFDTATSTHNIRFLDSWTHATPEAKAKADVKNAGFAKAKITMAAKKKT